MARSKFVLPSDPERRMKLLRLITNLARLPEAKRKEILAEMASNKQAAQGAIHPAP